MAFQVECVRVRRRLKMVADPQEEVVRLPDRPRQFRFTPDRVCDITEELRFQI